ncbi:Holliday junction resolvase RuvX [Litorivita sp. NS0012-18]|uniref:Holliday junction resolvase RuvX n=1 Tax=Litorivita sp. NS0012-18 TaxID=3127655 RepID=UPI00310BD86E
MICEEMQEFAAACGPVGALLGLDFGDKTIGVAVSDGLRSVASPLETVRRKKFTVDAARLQEIIAHRAICGIVLGLPRNMDGSEGPRCQKTRAFARNFARLSDLPITYWDERLSTVAAERALLEADASRARRAEVIDNIAASYILQGALDRLGHLGASR